MTSDQITERYSCSFPFLRSFSELWNCFWWGYVTPGIIIYTLSMIWRVGFDNRLSKFQMLQDVESQTNSEMSSIAILPSLNHLNLPSVISKFDAFRLQWKHVIKTPLIWQAFTKWHTIGASMSIGLPWLLGLGVGRSTLHGVVTAINYAIQCISVSRY